MMPLYVLFPVVSHYGQLLLDLFDDMDTLMQSHRSYLLGNWIASAVSMASTASDRDLFKFNAINQLTLWGPAGEISDYAGKQWAGLIKQWVELTFSFHQ